MPDPAEPVRRAQNPAQPRVSGLLLGAFGIYTRRYLRRHFHSIRLSTSGWLPDNENGIPKVIFLNHASWWDPLVCLHLQRQMFARHTGYAPIDAKAVEKYAFFKRLGFFGVETDSPRGAARFFRIASHVLAQPWNVLWVTPQGRFADVRERPIQFKHGLGLLAARLGRIGSVAALASPRIQFVPLAIEYPYWHERLPEILLRFGQPLDVQTTTPKPLSPAEWSTLLEERLASNMDSLAEESLSRRPDAFMPLLQGSAGVGAVYDFWRRARAVVSGTQFDPHHGRL
ncbi:MAG: lysophospholipid acyltransferase family protein [Limisphaerales bacterium]